MALKKPPWLGPQAVGQHDPNTAYLMLQRMEIFPKLFSNFIPLGKTLEAGCGQGWLTLELARLGHRVTALDFHGRYFDQIRRQAEENNLEINLERGNVMALPFPDDEFDVVVNIAVLEHLSDPLKGAAELQRVTKPGGYLILGMPNWHSLWMILKKMEMWIANNIDENTRMHTAFSYRSIRQMFLPYGFKQLSAHPVAHLSIPAAIVNRLPFPPSIIHLLRRLENATVTWPPFARLGQLVIFIFQAEDQ